MNKKQQLLIKTDKIDVMDAYAFMDSPEHGACASFIGKIRNRNMGKDVTGVSYDIFEPLAIKEFENICLEARERWGDDLSFYVAHYKGQLKVGEISVIIFVGSVHRDEAFQACRYVIEEIKHRSPIWKQEHYIDGNSEWVKGHALCQGH